MKNDELYLLDLKNFFSYQKYFRKSDLRSFYRNKYKVLEEKTFRRILYALERDNIIIAKDTGIYTLRNEDNFQSRKKFIPIFTPELKLISDTIQKTFPYTKILVWETRILYDFMLHLPGQNSKILETEEEAIESIFNFLQNQFPGKVFMEPGQEILEKYVSRSTESIIVSTMIKRSPCLRVNGIPCPKLEKILVDIFSDKNKFYIFQGQELITIYKTAFQNYKISERTLFWYAERRKVHQKLRTFIQNYTEIQLIHSKGMNK